MFERKAFACLGLIREKAKSIQIILNNQLSQENQLFIKFSNVWLGNLKKEWI